MFFNQINFAEASNGLPTSFNITPNISEQPPSYSPILYKPTLVNFPIGSADERGILWVGLDDNLLNVYWDLLSFIPVSTNDVSNQISLQLYPNPTTDELILAGIFPHEELNITITDITGRIASAFKIEKISAEKIKLSISEFTPGIYFCNIKTKSGFITEKFVVSK